MANYNVTLQVGISKGAMAEWSYNSSTSGVGTSSGNPLDLEIGDTVTFINHSSSVGYARVRNLSIFTSNADIDIAAGGSNVSRTVASGALTLDTIVGWNTGESHSDSFYFERQAAASDTTPPVITRLGSATVTLNEGGTYSDAGATATDNIDGTITGSIVTVNPVNVNTAGTYTVTYNVSDAAGNAATQVTRSVTVQAAADTTPDAFTFTDVTSATTATVYNTYDQITGIDTATAVTVSGSGTFSISSTTTSGTFGTTGNISNNQYLHVRQTSSSSSNTSVSSTYTIGGVSDTWSVDTSADIVPNPFSFTDTTSALSTVSYSYTQITGIDQSITASRSSGTATFAISSSTTVPASGNFTTANKSVSNNQYLHVKDTSSSSNSTTITSAFSAGGVSASWNLTTVAASGGSTAYGLRIMPPTGTIARLDTSDRTIRVLATFTGTLTQTASVSHTLTGFSPSDSTIGIDWEGGRRQYVSLTTSTNTLVISRANDPLTHTIEYQIKVFKI